MLSPSNLRALSHQATVRAAAGRRRPFVIFTEADVDKFPPYPFPVIGDYKPEGWEMADELFCDSTGLGAPDEAALTQVQLRDQLKRLVASEATYGFAITSVGQFQFYLGVFKRTTTAKTKTEANLRDFDAEAKEAAQILSKDC